MLDELGIRLQVGLQVDDPFVAQPIQRRLDRAEILLPDRHTRRLENPPIPFLAPGQRHAIPMSGREVDEGADRAARPPLLVHQGHGVFEQSDGPSIVVDDVELELAHFRPFARRDLHRQLIVRHLCAVGAENAEVGRALRFRRRLGGVRVGRQAEGPGEGAVDADAAALRVGRDADADWQHVQERLLLEHVPGELTIGFCQPLLPLFGAGLGLPQRQFRAFAVRDIDADSVERPRPSVVVVHGASASLHPSPFAAAGLEPELDDVIGSVRDGLVHHSPHGGTILRVDEVEEPCLRAVEPARLQAEDLLELAAPPDFVGREVPRPRAHGAAAHRQRQHVAALAQIVGTIAQRRFETLAVGHRRAQEQPGRREHAHEYLELDQAVVEILACERAAALARMPDRDCRRAQDDERGHRQPAAHGRTNHQREDCVLDGVRTQAEQLPEHQLRQENRAGDEQGCPQRLLSRPLVPRDGQDRRRDDDGAEGVAEPPIEPELEELRPLLNPCGAQRDDADRGADGGAERRRDDQEPEDVGNPAEWEGEAGEPAQHPHGEHCLESVARRNDEGGPDRRAGPRVREKRTRPHRRPETEAAEQQRGERNSRRRPDRRDLLGDDCELEADPGGGEVRQRHGGANRRRPEPRTGGSVRRRWGRPFQELPSSSRRIPTGGAVSGRASCMS